MTTGETDRQGETSLSDSFGVSDLHSVQDVLNSILLSESVYKAHERGAEAVAEAFTLGQKSFAPGLITVTRLQCSLPHVQHRYVVGSSDEALYVAFMGTKAMRDVISDVNYVQTALWPGFLGHASDVPTAHQGFLARSESVHVELLYAHASQQSKRLVLCGHSLGGAVAQLCTLRLLRDLPSSVIDQGRVKCVSFAAPPLGNSALANTISVKGWSGLFYNLTLPEDIVPRLMAMQSSVSVPATAAEAMLTGSHADRPGMTKQGLPELGNLAEPASAAEPEEKASEPAVAFDCPASPEPQHWMKGPMEAQVSQASGEGPDQSGSGQPHGSPGQAWRSRLRSSLERLRSVTADSSTSQPASRGSEQPALPGRGELVAPPGRATGFASTAARYLPIYVHIGSQHHLHAPPGEASLRPTSLLESAEDAESLAALNEQSASAAAAPQDAASAGTSPGQQRATGGRGYFSLPIPAYRSYMSILVYHRMFAIRHRAAALCAASAGWVRREGGRPAQLCDDAAPPLNIAAASCRLPPSRPLLAGPSYPGGQQQSSRWPSLQWASTLGALTGLIHPIRHATASTGQQSWWPWRGREADAPQPSSELPSDDDAASGLSQDKDAGVGQQINAAGSNSQAAQPAPSLARWLWRPWETGGAHPTKADPNPEVDVQRGSLAPQPRARPWLSWGGAGTNGEGGLSAQSARMPLRISVCGRGLASCTKARVLAASGAWCPAHIVTLPALPPLHTGPALNQDPLASCGDDATQSVQRLRGAGTGLWEMGRRIGRAVSDRVAGQQAQQAAAEEEERSEELVLEAVLPPAMASSVERGLLAQQGAQGDSATGLLEVQLRSDFFVRRIGAALRPCLAWVLSDSADVAEMVMGGLCAPPGLASQAEASPFSTAIAGAVRFISLWPDTPRAATLSVMAGLAARRLRATSERPDGDPARQVHLQPSQGVAAGSSHKLERPDNGLDQRMRGDEHEPAATLTSRISGPAARAISWAANASAAMLGTETSSQLAAWAVRARQGAGDIRQGIGSQLRLLQHRRVWRALAAQSAPQLLILCLTGAQTGGDAQQAGRFFGQFSKAHAGYASPVEENRWEAFTGSSARDAESVRMLLEAAHASSIPVLVVVMPSSWHSWERRSPLPLGLEAASGGFLVLHNSMKQLGSNEAWQLKMAVYRALSDGMQGPHIRSKF